MSMHSRSLGLSLAALLMGAVAATSFAADDAPQTIKAGALSFKAPAAWKSEKPSNTMRVAQVKVAPVAGDAEPAELAVTLVPRRGGRPGGERQAVGGPVPRRRQERPEGQGRDEEGDQRRGPPASRSAGRYVAAMMPGQAGRNDKPNYRLLGAIVAGKDATYYFKLTGPDKTVLAASKAFDTLIESMTLDGK